MIIRRYMRQISTPAAIAIRTPSLLVRMCEDLAFFQAMRRNDGRLCDLHGHIDDCFMRGGSGPGS